MPVEKHFGRRLPINVCMLSAGLLWRQIKSIEECILIELCDILSANGFRQARQALVEPVVYLDTWAIRHFSENEEFGDRFRTALLCSRGTLALSDINLIEFTSFESPRHSEAAGEFVDSLLPQIFLMRCDPSKVIEREEEFIAGRLQQSPAGDEKALEQFADAAARRGGKFSMSAWFSIVHSERDRLKIQLPLIAKVFYDQVRNLRKQQEPQRLNPIRHIHEIARGRPATHQLMRAIVRDLSSDHRLPEDTNSAIDLLHAIVPGAYCNFVLLDRQWSARLARAAIRLKDASIPIRLLGTYSKQNRGVEQFLLALEQWSSQA